MAHRSQKYCFINNWNLIPYRSHQWFSWHVKRSFPVFRQILLSIAWRTLVRNFIHSNTSSNVCALGQPHACKATGKVQIFYSGIYVSKFLRIAQECRISSAKRPQMCNEYCLNRISQLNSLSHDLLMLLEFFHRNFVNFIWLELIIACCFVRRKHNACIVFCHSSYFASCTLLVYHGLRPDLELMVLLGCSHILSSSYLRCRMFYTVWCENSKLPSGEHKCAYCMRIRLWSVAGILNYAHNVRRGFIFPEIARNCR